MTNRLTQAIEILYSAFDDVPKPTSIDGCPCCMTAEELDRLLSIPRKELTGDDLGSYAASAFLTVGSLNDYLYLLPRILEISITDESWWPDIEVTGRAIRETKVSDWPEHRQQALASLFESVIEHIVENGEHHRIDGWMCGAGRTFIDVRPCLSIIEKNEDAVLEYWKANAGKLDEGKLGNEFWDLPNPQYDEIVQWFRSPQINLIYANEYGYRMG